MEELLPKFRKRKERLHRAPYAGLNRIRFQGCDLNRASRNSRTSRAFTRGMCYSEGPMPLAVR